MEGYAKFKDALKELLRIGPKGLPDFVVLQQRFTKLQQDYKCFRARGMELDQNEVWKKCYDVADACKTCLKHVRESAKLKRLRCTKVQAEERQQTDWYHGP